MKRYLIFAALGPLLGGFILLLVTTYTSGYWTHTDFAEVRKLFLDRGSDSEWNRHGKQWTKSVVWTEIGGRRFLYHQEHCLSAQIRCIQHAVAL